LIILALLKRTVCANIGIFEFIGNGEMELPHEIAFYMRLLRMLKHCRKKTNICRERSAMPAFGADEAIPFKKFLY